MRGVTAPPHVVVIGTGLTALTLARTLLTSVSSISITLLDKANAPGGRLSSRQYDNGTVLEPGVRVFESPTLADGTEGAFGTEVERWRAAGWVREVPVTERAGEMGAGRWWEGVGGIKALVAGLVSEVTQLGGDRLRIQYGVQAANPTPTSLTPPINLTFLVPLPQPLPAFSLLVNTAPTPQILQLLPFHPLPTLTTYSKTIAFLLPTLKLPAAQPKYHRNPHAKITSISTGYDIDGNSLGIVFQATPDMLGVTFEKDVSDDAAVRAAFWAIIKEGSLIPAELIDESLTGRQAQVKRWKFAQIDAATDLPPVVRVEGHKEIIIMEGGRVIFAGDGTAGGQGGLEGSYRAGIAAAIEVQRWLSHEGQVASAVL